MSRPLIGIAALARATFDVPFAESVASQAFDLLDSLDVELAGPRQLLFDAEAARAALADLQTRPLDLLLLLQVTFTDATMTVALAEAVEAPLALWGFPEPRAGGRLRLNSLCGVNLAAHALAKRGNSYRYLYCQPDADDAATRLAGLLSGSHPLASAASPTATEVDQQAATRVRERLARARIGLVGSHPDGFETCVYDAQRLATLTGTQVERIELPSVFAAAGQVSSQHASELRGRVAADLGNLDDLEQEPLDKTLRTYAALSDLAEDHGLDGLAVRCWPEFFTDYGCAACGAMAMLNEDGRPAACEADVYGNISTLMLQELAQAPVFMADLVDMDISDDTGVFWHCGLAPLSMADPQVAPMATVHSNRRKPLLNEFPLKPGRITIARLSQSRNQTRLMIGGAEMLRAPKSFSGTSGVVRFDRPSATVLDTIMAEGLEHHYAFAYGEHRPGLRALAQQLDIPVLELS